VWFHQTQRVLEPPERGWLEPHTTHKYYFKLEKLWQQN